ncbi:MAG: RNA-directed DNA polymerase [Firmicutes bacterium]|nr:RNA-directed DNA polymerase [Bacillota bacterium]
MWKYLTKEHKKEFILSLNLIGGKFSDTEKLNILYAISNNSEKYYTTKYINKKDGTKRELLVPNKTLKNIQKNILNNALNDLEVSKYACAYIKNKSLKDNASPHINQKVVLKLDIKDFFTSITFEEIYKVIPNELFPTSIKVLMLKLCTYYDYLPQGAPTSPYLSNLVLKNFDNYIGTYCKERNINYTRYCDDLTFSGDFDVKKLKNKVQAFLEEIGYNLNDKKTKVIKNNKRQIVTGLVVNEKVNIPISYRKKIRQEMYYINKYGIDSHLKYINNTNKEKYINSLKGKINYCLNINPNNTEFQSYLKKLNNLL